MADLKNNNDLNETKIKIQQENPELTGSQVHAIALAISEEKSGAEIGSTNEYYNMMEHGERIVNEFNDGVITHDDLNHYFDFTKELYEREVEINMSIGIIEGIPATHMTPFIKERLDLLKEKRMKLVQTRQIIDRATDGKRYVNEQEVTPKEQKMAGNLKKALVYTAAGKEIPTHAARMMGIEVPQDVAQMSLMKRQEKANEIVTEENLGDRLNRLRGLAGKTEANHIRKAELMKKRNISHAFNSQEAQALLAQRAETERSL